MLRCPVMHRDPLARLKFGLRLFRLEGKLRYFWTISMLIKSMIFTGQTIYAVREGREPRKLIAIIASYSITLLAMFKFSALVHYQKEMKELYEIIEQQFWNYKMAGEKLRKQIGMRFKFINMLVLNHVTVGCLWGGLFLFQPLVDVPEGEKHVPSLIWVPFNFNQSPVYEIMFTLSVISTYSTIAGNFLYDFFFIYSAQHVSVQLKLLCELLENLSKDVADRDQSIISQRLDTCIKHHILLLFCGEKLKAFSCIGLWVQLVLTIIGLVMMGFMVSTVEDVTFQALMPLGIAFSLSLEFILSALQSSDLLTQSLMVAQAAYHSNWFRFSPEVRLKLVMMMRVAQRGVVITAGGMADVGNETIVFVAEKVTSMVALLKALNYEHGTV